MQKNYSFNSGMVYKFPDIYVLSLSFFSFSMICQTQREMSVQIIIFRFDWVLDYVFPLIFFSKGSCFWADVTKAILASIET